MFHCLAPFPADFFGLFYFFLIFDPRGLLEAEGRPAILFILFFCPRLFATWPCQNDPWLTHGRREINFRILPKWSRGGPKAVPERRFFVSQQNHAVPAGSCWSARIIMLCQDHHALPGSSSSSRIMILVHQHHDFDTVAALKGFAMTDTK